jgi:hypothetical protein
MCLVLPILGTCVWLVQQQTEIRKEVKQQLICGMDKSQLVPIVLSDATQADDLHWKRMDEFRYLGQMYDVVETDINADGHIVYWCLHDKKETALHQQLNLLVAKALGQQPDHQQQQNHILDFFKGLCLPPTLVELKTWQIRSITDWFPTPDSSLISLACQPPTPPPNKQMQIFGC